VHKEASGSLISLFFASQSNPLSDLVVEAAKGNTVAVERLLKETSFDVNIVVNVRDPSQFRITRSSARHDF